MIPAAIHGLPPAFDTLTVMNDFQPWRVLELNGGRVECGDSGFFLLPPVAAGYADAQVDDYGQAGGRFAWRPGVTLSLSARFSHDAQGLRGTAGFGFWNAPFGDPSRRRPARPQAVWFFFASAPSDLPFAPGDPGRGWFAGTIDAATRAAAALIPAAPGVLLLNQFAATRRRVWPAVRRRLGIHAAPVLAEMTAWHDYRLEWRPEGARFQVDGVTILETPQAPRGPLGFVCWLDNQCLSLTPRGRFRAGVLQTDVAQWMEIDGLTLVPAN